MLNGGDRANPTESACKMKDKHTDDLVMAIAVPKSDQVVLKRRQSMARLMLYKDSVMPSTLNHKAKGRIYIINQFVWLDVNVCK